MAAVVFLLAMLVASAVGNTCIGFSRYRERDAGCRKRTNRDSCLAGYAMHRTLTSASCVWQFRTKYSYRSEQYIENRGDSVVLTGLNNTDNICGRTVTITLPAQANNSWSAYTRLVGGPQDVNVMRELSTPRQDMTVSACTAGLGMPLSCQTKLISPRGYAQDPNFFQNAAIIEFQTKNVNLINMWKTMGRLKIENSMRFLLTTYAHRCYTTSNPTPTPIIRDQAIFGSTDHILTTSAPYRRITYRSYRLTNVSGVEWEVSVPKSFAAGLKKTPMTSMLIRESKFNAWEASCLGKPLCPPPVGIAVVFTTCTSLKCKNGRSALAMGGTYRLLVSYPTIAAEDWGDSSSDVGPVSTPYHTQLVSVTIWAKDWRLSQPTVRTSISGGARVAVTEETLQPQLPLTRAEFLSGGPDDR